MALTTICFSAGRDEDEARMLFSMSMSMSRCSDPVRAKGT
jgi:hypothetical protein